MPDTITAVGSYHLQRVSLTETDQGTLAEWESFSRRHGGGSPQQDPVWLRGFFAGELNQLRAYFVYQSGELCGVAPFLLKEWPLKWHLGEVTVAEPRLRRLRLLGSTLNFPEDEAVYDLLFKELAKSEGSVDAVHLEDVPLDSFLWKYIQTSPLIRALFRMYVPDSPTPRLELRFRGSFDEYMKKFSTKTRSTLRRKVKRIREGVIGPMRLVRYSNVEDVGGFLESAVQISKKTYQWKIHQKGMSATDVMSQRLLFAAQHGWLRCYLLFCDDVPCAFLAGFQFGNTYSLLDTGFDPDLSKHSIGTVLQLLAVEDLFTYDPPEVFDFGTYGGWKEMLSTDSHPEVKVLLFRPGAHMWFVQAGHHSCQVLTKSAADVLERFHLKARFKKVIRGLSMKETAPGQKAEEQEAED